MTRRGEHEAIDITDGMIFLSKTHTVRIGLRSSLGLGA